MKRVVIALTLVAGISAFAYAQSPYPPWMDQSSLPQPGDIIPPTDTLNGAVGTSPRYMRQDAPRPTISQRATVNTAADGSWSVTWAKAFISSTPVIVPSPLAVGATLPVQCVVLTRNATTATGKCWTDTAVFLSLLGINILASPGNFASQPVMITGLEPSQ